MSTGSLFRQFLAWLGAVGQWCVHHPVEAVIGVVAARITWWALGLFFAVPTFSGGLSLVLGLPSILLRLGGAVLGGYLAVQALKDGGAIPPVSKGR
jgi:hypothetical protein